MKVFHYNGSLYFKKMFDKLYQVSLVMTLEAVLDYLEQLLDILPFFSFFSFSFFLSHPFSSGLYYLCRLIGNQSHQIGLVTSMNLLSLLIH